MQSARSSWVLMLACVLLCHGASLAQNPPVRARKVEEQTTKMLKLPGPGDRIWLRIDGERPPASLAEVDAHAVRSEREPNSAVLFTPDGEQHFETRTVPPNNACSMAQAISDIGEWTFDSSMATTDGSPHFACNFLGQLQITRDVWFRWTAPVTARFVAETCIGTAFDSKMAVYTDPPSCPPTDAQVLACNDDACSVQSRLSFNATAGQRYLIRIGSFPGQAGGPGTLRISYQAGQTLCTIGAGNCQARDMTNAFDATGFLMLDDFTPAQDGSITGLCFWGAYFNGVTDCQGSSPDQFVIAYYDDVGGVPGPFPYQEFFEGQYSIAGPIPTGNLINNSFPEYSYTLTHAALPVFANTCYWISIENRLPPPPMGNCAWYWERGSGGNGIGYRNTIRIDEDFAWCMNVTPDSPNECSLAAPPANDTCANAQVMVCSVSIQENQDNLFATTSINDPPFSCRFGGPAQGIGTMWYRFNASSTSARISLCGSPMGDTLIGVYSGTCGNLTQIACNDDTCALRSQVCATGLVIGQTYYVQVASYDDESRGSYRVELRCPCPTPPANDTCGQAQSASVPSSTTSSTFNATPEGTIPACGFSIVNTQGVWYRVTGNGRQFTASTCGGFSDYDTKLSVYCGSCSQLNCITENDDAPDCLVLSRVQWCTQPGQTYYVLVSGFNGAVGNFTLSFSQSSTNCTGAEDCSVCQLTCPTGGVPENETCGGDANGGCNVSPAVFQGILCGQTVCGTMFTDGTTRDTDWYQFSLSSPAVVTWSVQSESPIEGFILNTACPPAIIASGTTERCGTAIATAVLQPGTYRTFVGAIGDAYPCGSSNDYLASLQCGPIGACCTATDCQRVTQQQCANLGGFYAGDASVCPINYSTTACSNAFEDIEATGQTLILGDNEGFQVPLGFTFRFYGVDYAGVSVSSNGYLTFDSNSAAQINQAIPSPMPPNTIIAPLWDDLSPNANGTIRYEVRGTAPNRRFIVQWKNVPQFLISDSNTFQAVLFESGNCIEFRYGTITPESTPGDYTIGVENQSGASGTAIAGASATAGACFRMCPSLAPGGCQAIVPCPGDANGDRVVNFADVSSVVTFWGLPGPSGDANRDGLVDFSDITSVLENWGVVCSN